MLDQQRSSLCVCFVPHLVLHVIAHTSRQFSGLICDGETSNGGCAGDCAAGFKFTPSPMQQDTPPRLSQRLTQPMELTPTPTKDKGTTGKTSLRHSQEITQPAIPQLVEQYTQQREKLDNEEELIRECTAQYQQTGEGQPAATITDNPQSTATESLAQCQQTGECRMAHFIEASQPTHLISSTKDADMQPNPATPHPDAHGIATPRRSIGGRCRKWVVVSTQDTSLTNKRTCAACTICSKQFTPGEPRCTTSLRARPMHKRRPQD